MEKFNLTRDQLYHYAKYEDGILKLSLPKKAPKAVEEKDGYIAIEG